MPAVRSSNPGIVNVLPVSGSRHRESICAALEMIVAQYGSAYDRNVRVGPCGIVRELFHKDSRSLLECRTVDHHRNMFLIEDYAVLVVVDIGRVLKEVFFSVQRYRDYPVVLPCRMRDGS